MEHTLIPKDELEVFRSICQDFKMVFDIGARADIEMYKIHPDCVYHLFEPNPEFTKAIPQNENLIVNNFGLSDVEGDGFVYYEDVQSFLINPVAGGTDEGHRFSLKTLDNYAKDIPVIDFLKIDTEGMDYRILLGGAETIKKTKYIQFEYWDGVRKFVNLLGNEFDMFLMTEPRLLACITEPEYKGQLIPLDEQLITYIDDYLIKVCGAGGNILCKQK